MAGNAMVPGDDWGAVASGFRQGIGKQVVLCTYCVVKDGVIEPPSAVVVYEGYTLCLVHLPEHQEYVRNART